jgi:pentatricopeptide repeat protein
MIVQAMEDSGQHVNVETKTALLKGLSHAGHMKKAEALFASMTTAQGE